MWAPEEVRTFRGRPVAGEGVGVLNPSFDVTSHQLVSGYITEAGILQPPFDREIFTGNLAERTR